MTVTEYPALTAVDQPRQHMAALQRANGIRRAQARTKRHIFDAPSQAASRQRCAELLLDTPPHAGSMRIYDVLCACRGIGRYRAVTMLAHHEIGERRQLRQLTFRQCLVLAGDLHATDDYTPEAA